MKLSSRLEAVTVYARGAVCERAVQVPAGAGPRLTLTGLPLSLEPGSVRARTRGESAGPTVLQVRPGFDVALGDALNQSAERKALAAAEAELARVRLAVARVQKELDDVAGLAPVYGPRKKGEPPREAPVEATLALARFVAEELPALQAQKRALDDALRDATNAVRLREQRLAEASSASARGPLQLSRTAEVTLSGVPEGPLGVVVEYFVPGARWLPTYELQLGQAMAGGRLAMRAAVAQHTGEDWTGVALALSTADLDRRIERPTLRSLRIGRSQPPPPRSGWREPPPGLDALFSDYDALGASRPPPPPAPPVPAPRKSKKAPRAERAPVLPAPATPVVRAVSAEAPASMAMAPPPLPVGAAKGMLGRLAAPPPSRSASALPASRGRSAPPPSDALAELAEEAAFSDDGDLSFGGGGPGAYPEAPPPKELALAQVTVDEALLDYDLLRMPGAADPGRGRLQPNSLLEIQAVAVHLQVEVLVALLSLQERKAQSVDLLAPPPHACPPRESAGSFDYRYVCQTPADVPSVAAWKVVPVATADVAIAAEYQCVPAVEPKVYRTVALKNRSEHALLSGPVDVFVAGGFLLTAQLPTLAPGGDAETLGLGVEEAIKVARNTAFRETTGGLLGGSTVLPHEIAIDLENRTQGAATIEVRERIPVSDDDDVKIEEVKVEPAWRKDEGVRDGRTTRGARSWRLSLAPGEKRRLSAEFTVKIPSSKMLHGGNRRV